MEESGGIGDCASTTGVQIRRSRKKEIMRYRFT
jgi:hypothetical protein